ncbi:tetratricopeptide repeat protein [bacterium]|nr:tetratricopeptide repeat protein [bacterium]
MSRNLYWGVALFVGVLFLLPPSVSGQGLSFFVLGTLLIGLLAWIALAFDQDKFSQMTFGPALLLLVLVEAIVIAFSRDPAHSLNPVSHQLAYLLLFVLTFMLSRHRRSVRSVLVAFFSLGVLLAAYGLYQHLLGLLDTYQQVFAQKAPQGAIEQEIANRLLSRRAFSLFTYPNLFAGFIGMLLPIGFSLLLTVNRQWKAWIFCLGIVILVLGLYVSGSLGGWLAATAGMAVYFYLLQKRFQPGNRITWKVWLAGGVLAGLGAGVLCWLRGPQNLYADFSARTANWAGALHMGWEHLLTGVGPGLFGIVFPDYQLEHGYYVRFAHNFMVHKFAETGLLGLGVFLWFLYLAGKQLIENFNTCLARSQQVVALGLVSGVLTGLLHACVDLDLNFMKTSLLFWFFLGTTLGFATRRLVLPVMPAAPFGQLVRWGLGLLGILVLWKGGKSLPVEGLLYWATGLLLLVFFAGKTETLTSWPQWIKRIPLRWPLGVLLVWGVLAALVSGHPAGAISGLTLGLVGLLIYCLTVWVSRSGVILTRIMIFSATGLAIIALFQSAANSAIRVTANWPNANLLAAMLAMGFLGSLVNFIFAATNSKRRLLYAFVTLLLFFALLATGSIGGVLNIFAGSVVLLFWIRRRQPNYFKFALLALALMVVLIFLLPFQTGGRLSDIRNYHGQLYERFQLANSAVQMIGNRPITGFGPGNFKHAFERYNFPNVRGLSRYGKQAQFAHNEFLHLMAVIGLPGGLIVLWLLWLLFIYMRRQIRTTSPENTEAEIEDGKARMVAWCAIVGGLAQGLVDFNWHPPALFVWYMILLGIAVMPAVRTRQEDKSWLDIGAWLGRLQAVSRQPVLVLLLFVLVATATASIRPLISRYLENLGTAHRYKQDLKAADREFQRALSVHPFSSHAYDQLGQIWVDLYAVVDAENWFQLSEWAFKKALVLNSLDAFIHRHMGTLYGLKAARIPEQDQQHQYDLAERQYRLGIEKSPKKALLYFELGNLLRNANRMSAAERAWMQALKLEPNYAAALSNLGVAQEMRGDFESARANFLRALEVKILSPNAQGKYELELLSLNWVIIHHNLGHVLESQGKWEEAKHQYQEVLALEPDNSIAGKRLENLKKILP